MEIVKELIRMTRESASRGELRPGDNICTDRTGVLYYHHGIYVGKATVSNRYNNEEQREIDDAVIHFLPDDQSFGSASSRSSSSYKTDQCQRCFYLPQIHGVVISCLDCFLAGESLYIYIYSSSTTTYPPDKVIQTAFSYLRKERDFGKYRPILNNCEHFVNYCKTGEHYSNQAVTGVITGVVITTAAVAACTVS